MGDVVNLRTARKARDRAAKATIADANRARFGRTKAEKLTEETQKARRESLLDGARRDEPDPA